jgi:hypothetical protein
MAGLFSHARGLRNREMHDTHDHPVPPASSIVQRANPGLLHSLAIAVHLAMHSGGAIFVLGASRGAHSAVSGTGFFVTGFDPSANCVLTVTTTLRERTATAK